MSMNSEPLTQAPSSEFLSVTQCQLEPLSRYHQRHGGSATTTGTLRPKRPALAELSPANSKRTNLLLSAANGGSQVTPNEEENASKFPGLYYQNYLLLQDREQCSCSESGSLEMEAEGGRETLQRVL
jgi:hypothetical protein